MVEIVGKKRTGITAGIILIVICVLWIVPVLGLLVTSFRDENVVNKNGWWTAFKDKEGLTLSNYKQVLIGKDYTYVNSDGITVTARSQNLLLAFKPVGNMNGSKNEEILDGTQRTDATAEDSSIEQCENQWQYEHGNHRQ